MTEKTYKPQMPDIMEAIYIAKTHAVFFVCFLAKENKANKINALAIIRNPL